VESDVRLKFVKRKNFVTNGTSGRSASDAHFLEIRSHLFVFGAAGTASHDVPFGKRLA
jgi:hypothetical protein